MADTNDTAERWVPVPDWEGLYSVSDQGRVRSEARLVRCRWGDNHPVPEKILRTKIDRLGYPTVRLSRPDKRWGATVHKLVTAAFIGPRMAGMQVNHINGDKSDTRLLNLEYVTASENVKHAVRTGLRPLGEECRHAKLTRRDIVTIRAMYAAGGVSMANISDAYNVAHSLIHAIIHKRIWRHVVG